MTLSEIFDDPFVPSRSIQLNNKYWPGAKFSLIDLVRDAEQVLSSGDVVTTARVLRPLKQHFRSDGYFQKFLRRLHRLSLFKSSFGCITGRIDLPERVVAANRYSGPESRAVYPLAEVASFAELIAENAAIYKASYGRDFLRTNTTVRFAMPDERQADIKDFGPLSDFHNDEYKGISTIIYLNDVTDENGAFSYIEGSHLVKRSLILSAIHQCVEFDMLVTTPDGLASFPLEFRGSMGIGNFLEDDKVRTVSEFRRDVEGPVGTFVTFNGQYVMHRGGKPLAGTRTAAFLQPEGLVRHKMKSVRSVVFAKSYA
jgi:hypothetical protein